MVKTGEICKTCYYFGIQTETCDYIIHTCKSRLITAGKKIDPNYCDKYINEKRQYDAKESHEYLAGEIFRKRQSE